MSIGVIKTFTWITITIKEIVNISVFDFFLGNSYTQREKHTLHTHTHIPASSQ